MQKVERGKLRDCVGLLDLLRGVARSPLRVREVRVGLTVRKVKTNCTTSGWSGVRMRGQKAALCDLGLDQRARLREFLQKFLAI